MRQDIGREGCLRQNGRLWSFLFWFLVFLFFFWADMETRETRSYMVGDGDWDAGMG